jgi:DNA-binding NarL/FixJ family response regulator
MSLANKAQPAMYFRIDSPLELWSNSTPTLEYSGMSPNSEVPPTSLLLIDGNDTDRNYFAKQLKGRSPDYEILEATDGESGLLLYRSRRIDCVVVALELPDQSGLKVLVDLVPVASRPNVAVVILTNRLQRGLGEIARQNGAYACFVKQFMSGEDLDRAIQRAMAFVGQMPKEDRYRPL